MTNQSVFQNQVTHLCALKAYELENIIADFSIYQVAYKVIKHLRIGLMKKASQIWVHE